MGVFVIIGIIVYLIVGYLYVKGTMSGADGGPDGEVLGALIAIWPLLLLGVLVGGVLKRLGIYNKFIERVFIAIISFLVVALILYHLTTLFKG